MGAFRARYFLLDDPLAEVDSYHRSLDALDEAAEPPQPASKLWTKTTQGNDDEHSLLTLFLCLAAGVPKKTLLTEKAALSDAELAPLEAVAEDVGVDPAPYYTTRTLGEAFLAKCDFERLRSFEPLFEGEAGPAQAARPLCCPTPFCRHWSAGR